MSPLNESDEGDEQLNNITPSEAIEKLSQPILFFFFSPLVTANPKGFAVKENSKSVTEVLLGWGRGRSETGT